MTSPASSSPNATSQSRPRALRPKDAATLIILDRTGKDTRLLMGRRTRAHVFMPGQFVFPGGRVDRSDGFAKVAAGFRPQVEQRLTRALKAKGSANRAKAFAVAAIRETYEEAGLLIGEKVDNASAAAPDSSPFPGKGLEAFHQRAVKLDLSAFSFIGRAITPPGLSRRFDTRFLAVDAQSIADRLHSGTGPTEELEDLTWFTLGEALELADVPRITRQILTDLRDRLTLDPNLDKDMPVPFYFHSYGKRVRQLL